MDTYSLSGLFEHTARNYPDNPAIRGNEGIITYSELDEDSKSPGKYMAILANLKCGCSFIPIDPDYISERVEYMIEDSGAMVLLAYSDFSKGSNLKVGDDCSIGSDSVVLYDSIMEKGSQLDSLSLLTKGETLKTGTRWVGIPARSIGRKVEQIARRR